MRNHPKASLLRIAGIILILLVGGFVWRDVYWIYLWTRDGKPCEHRSRIVSRNQRGDRVEFAEDFCAGPAFSNAGTLSLISKAGGDPQRFFFYQENNGDPAISWAGNEQLTVKVGPLEDIYVQKTEIGGIRIRYDIGRPSAN